MSVNYIDKSTGDLIRVAGGGNDILYADSPIGSIIPYGGTTAPDGFLLCQGQAVSRTTYAELFAVIGTSFGSGDGSTTFNVPDLRGEFLRGAGTNSHTNQGNGGAVGEHQNATAVPVISARYNGSDIIAEITSPGDETGTVRSSVINPDSQFSKTSNSVYGAFSVMGSSTPGDQEYSVRPTNTSVNYIIKAIQVDAPADFAPVDVVESGNMKAVTSNAVYDAINDVQIITPAPVTGGAAGTVTWDSFDVKKLGKLVNITINGMRHTSDVSIPGATIAATGLPKPALGRIYIAGINYGDDGNRASAYIDADGNLGLDTGFLLSTSTLYGSCSYISV